jgi:hypothetical protein
MYPIERYFLSKTWVKDRHTDLVYEFSTLWGAKSFYDAVTKYERDKLYSSNSIISKGSTVGIDSNVITSISSFILNLGGEEYKLSLYKKANMIQRLFLRIMGFKKS